MVVQRNEDIQNPMEIARAVWKADAPDLRRCEVYVYRLETGFPDEEEEATETAPAR